MIDEDHERPEPLGNLLDHPGHVLCLLVREPRRRVLEGGLDGRAAAGEGGDELPATVMAGSARVVELSYGGVRLELPRPPGPGRTPIEIKLPTFGVSVQAVACWSQLAEEGGSWRCGAEVAPVDSDATRTWRWIVDSLN